VKRIRTLSAIASVAVVVAMSPIGSRTSAAPVAANYAADASLNQSAADLSGSLSQTLAGDSTFAGAEITAGGVQLNVAGVADSAMAAAVGVAGAAPITTRHVANSMAALLSVQAGIEAVSSSLAAQGIDLSSVGIDVDANKVRVGLSPYTADGAAVIVAEFGSGLVVVDSTTENVAAADRFADSPPWFGGDELRNTVTGGTCSSWFPVYSGSTSYALLAGHCGSAKFTNDGHTVGTVNKSHWVTLGTTDVERIPVSTNGGDVWTDGLSSRTVKNMMASTMVVGTLLCTDGYYDLEVCNVKITEVDVSVTYGGKTLTQQVKGQQTAGKEAFHEGDSGGPVYQLNSDGTARAYGMAVADDASNSAIGYFTPASFVCGAMGVSIRFG
jgi:hypothetical protein